jgi:hypothetical protein
MLKYFNIHSIAQHIVRLLCITAHLALISSEVVAASLRVPRQQHVMLALLAVAPKPSDDKVRAKCGL